MPGQTEVQGEAFLQDPGQRRKTLPETPLCRLCYVPYIPGLKKKAATPVPLMTEGTSRVTRGLLIGQRSFEEASSRGGAGHLPRCRVTGGLRTPAEAAPMPEVFLCPPTDTPRAATVWPLFLDLENCRVLVQETHGNGRGPPLPDMSPGPSADSIT